MSGISTFLAAFDPQNDTYVPVQIKDKDNYDFEKSPRTKTHEKVTFVICLLLF